MAKKSANDWKAEGADVKKLLDAARKKEHNCAIYICAEGVAIEADPRLSGDNLSKKAKKRDGATPTGVTGKLKVSGTNIQVTCDTEPPGALETKLKQYLAKVGLKLKPVLIMPVVEEKKTEAPPPAEKPAPGKEEEADSDIGEIIAKARKKPLNVAWLIGDKGLVLKAHPKLPVDKLRQQAKSEGGGQRGALGVMTISGKTVLLSCEEEPPKSFPRLAKTWMAEQGHAYKVTIALPDGAELTDEEEEADKEAARADRSQDLKEELEEEKKQEIQEEKESQHAEEKDSLENEGREEEGAEENGELSKEKLTEDLKHVSEIFKLSFDGMDKKQADELKGALKSIADTVKNGDLVSAQNMMNKLGLLTGVTPNSPMQAITMAAPSDKKKDGDGGVDPAELRKRKKALIDDFAKIKPDLQKTLGDADSDIKKELQDLIAQFGKQTKGDEIDDAQASLEALKKTLQETEDPDDDLPPDARGQRTLELGELEASIDALIAGLGGMEALEQTDGI